MVRISAVKIIGPGTRNLALDVIYKVYRQEKHWINSAQHEIPEDIALTKSMLWFLAMVDSKPVGVLRLCYDPPLIFPPDFKAT